MEKFHVSSEETKESAVGADNIETNELNLTGFDEKQEPTEILSDVESESIRSELNTEQDVIPYHDGQEEFAKMIDSMSLDELREEREKLIEWGVFNDEAVEKQRAADEEFNSRIEGLSKEQLQTLREKLDNKDPEILAVFEQDDTTDEDGTQKVLRRK